MSWFIPRSSRRWSPMALGGAGRSAGRRGPQRPRRRHLVAGGVLAVAAVALVDGCAATACSTGCATRTKARAARRRLLGRDRLSHRARRCAGATQDARSSAPRLEQFLSAIEASPNGVLLLDDADQIDVVQCARGRPLRARPAARPPAARDQPRARARLRRRTCRAAARAAGDVRRRRGGRGTLSVPVRRYGDGMKLVLSQDITRARALGRRCGAISSPTSRTRSARR